MDNEEKPNKGIALYDGAIVKLPDYISPFYGRVIILSDSVFKIGGTQYIAVRLADPGAEIIVLPAHDLEYVPVHECPNCDCKYPPSSEAAAFPKRSSI